MLSGDISHFCKYGRYFLIGYYLSETDKLLLLASVLRKTSGLKIMLTG